MTVERHDNEKEQHFSMTTITTDTKQIRTPFLHLPAVKGSGPAF